MNSISESTPPSVNGIHQQPAEDAVSFFRRRTLSNRRWSCPRRYVMGILLFNFLIINIARDTHANYVLYRTIFLKETPVHPVIRNWTIQELVKIRDGVLVSDIFAQLIGGLLLYVFSSHKFLLLSAIVSSIMHMLIPVAVNYHSVSLLALVLLGQGTLTVPIYTAIFSMLKDWTPLGEKYRLVTIWLCGLFIQCFTSDFPVFAKPITNYIIGIAGIVWALFWYNTTSDTPQNDPLISESEFLYLESNVPPDVQEKIKLKDVPWISIGKSPQVWILCLIFVKFSFSIETIKTGGMFFRQTKEYYYYYFLPFGATFLLLSIGSAFLMDFLAKRYSNKTLIIRKLFLCGGFTLQCLLMLGVFAPSPKILTVCSGLAYCIFAISVPSFLTYPLDLSPRYVSLIVGIGFAFYSTATLCAHYYIYFLFAKRMAHLIHLLFLVDGIISLIIVVLFAVWGDVEEQRWSLISSSQHRINKSCPQPDAEDNLNLVSDT